MMGSVLSSFLSGINPIELSGGAPCGSLVGEQFDRYMRRAVTSRFRPSARFQETLPMYGVGAESA